MKIEIDKPVVPKWFDDWYKTFNGNKTNALHVLNRTGWGYALTYYNDQEVEFYASKLRDLSGDDCFEMAQEYLSQAIIVGYEIEQEPLYYAKNKLTGQYLGDMTSDEEWVYAPRWIVDKRDLHVEKLTKDEFRRIYGLDNTNADFEAVE